MAYCMTYFHYTSPDNARTRDVLRASLKSKFGIAQSMVKQVVQFASIAYRKQEWRCAIGGRNREADTEALHHKLQETFVGFDKVRAHFRTGTGAGGAPIKERDKWLMTAMESWRLRSVEDLKILQRYLAAEISKRSDT